MNAYGRDWPPGFHDRHTARRGWLAGSPDRTSIRELAGVQPAPARPCCPSQVSLSVTWLLSPDTSRKLLDFQGQDISNQVLLDLATIHAVHKSDSRAVSNAVSCAVSSVDSNAVSSAVSSAFSSSVSCVVSNVNSSVVSSIATSTSDTTCSAVSSACSNAVSGVARVLFYVMSVVLTVVLSVALCFFVVRSGFSGAF